MAGPFGSVGRPPSLRGAGGDPARGHGSTGTREPPWASRSGEGEGASGVRERHRAHSVSSPTGRNSIGWTWSPEHSRAPSSRGESRGSDGRGPDGDDTSWGRARGGTSRSRYRTSPPGRCTGVPAPGRPRRTCSWTSAEVCPASSQRAARRASSSRMPGGMCRRTGRGAAARRRERGPLPAGDRRRVRPRHRAHRPIRRPPTEGGGVPYGVFLWMTAGRRGLRSTNGRDTDGSIPRTRRDLRGHRVLAGGEGVRARILVASSAVKGRWRRAVG